MSESDKSETSSPLNRREIEDLRLELKVYFANKSRERHMFNRICDQAVRSFRSASAAKEAQLSQAVKFRDKSPTMSEEFAMAAAASPSHGVTNNAEPPSPTLAPEQQGSNPIAGPDDRAEVGSAPLPSEGKQGETPRTDAEVFEASPIAASDEDATCMVVEAKFARQLERELEALRSSTNAASQVSSMETPAARERPADAAPTPRAAEIDRLVAYGRYEMAVQKVYELERSLAYEKADHELTVRTYREVIEPRHEALRLLARGWKEDADQLDECNRVCTDLLRVNAELGQEATVQRNLAGSLLHERDELLASRSSSGEPVAYRWKWDENLEWHYGDYLISGRDYYQSDPLYTAPVSATRDTADAARYRWLRNKSVPPHNFYLSVPVEFAGVSYKPHEVDAAIDAAIASSDGREAS